MKKRSIGILVMTAMILSVIPTASVGFAAASDGADPSAGKPSSVEMVLTDLPVKWDLTGLYADENAFEADMKRIEELIPQIESYRGTLNSAEGILEFIESPALLEIKAIFSKAQMYTDLLNALDTSDHWASDSEARLQEVGQRVDLAGAFVDPEITAIPLKERKKIFSEKSLLPYAYYFKKYTDPDQVFLSEEASRVKTTMDSSQTSKNTYDVFENVERPEPTFKYPDKTEGVLTPAVYSEITSSKEYDHEFRKKISILRDSMRAPYANTYASLLEGQMRSNWAEAQIYGFDSTLDAALHSTDVDPVVYEKIIAFAHDLLPDVYEYYKTKKDLLGLDEMMLCDLDLPVTDYEVQKISYEEAVNTGRSAIAVWGDEYLDTFDRIMKSGHIDVYPSDTKRSGAFETLAGNETLPFILYNFNGLETYTSTIVHEMGHAVYSQFSAENQNAYSSEPDIFTQEVASTANELMFHRKMIDNAATREEKLFWLENELSLFLGAILRQCMYSEFEDYCYKTIEGGASLNAKEMNAKWLELEKLYYGEAITIPESNGIDWARIPHLYYNYYVYKYATSMTYAASVCSQADERGQQAIDDYMAFLKAGKTADPVSLLAIAGVDPLKDETYEKAGELVRNLIREYTETAKE